jgi:hypothetical protein
MIQPSRLSVVAFCLALTACGGGGGGGNNGGTSNASSGSTTTQFDGEGNVVNGNGSNDTSNTKSAAPILADAVLFSDSNAADGVTMTVDHAGIVRAFGSGTGANVSIAAGTKPLSLSGNTSTGDGWLASGNAFEQSTVTLSPNTDGATYTLKAQSASTLVSNSVMRPASLVTPTADTLTGDFGLNSTSIMTITGTSFTGYYTNTCAWSGTLNPQGQTIDVTNITFQTSTVLNPNNVACNYAGKVYSGTAYLLGPSAAYPKGTLQMIFDDGGSSDTPTVVQMYNFPRH